MIKRIRLMEEDNSLPNIHKIEKSINDMYKSLEGAKKLITGPAKKDRDLTNLFVTAAKDLLAIKKYLAQNYESSEHLS